MSHLGDPGRPRGLGVRLQAEAAALRLARGLGGGGDLLGQRGVGVEDAEVRRAADLPADLRRRAGRRCRDGRGGRRRGGRSRGPGRCGGSTSRGRCGGLLRGGAAEGEGAGVGRAGRAGALGDEVAEVLAEPVLGAQGPDAADLVVQGGPFGGRGRLGVDPAHHLDHPAIGPVVAAAVGELLGPVEGGISLAGLGIAPGLEVGVGRLQGVGLGRWVRSGVRRRWVRLGIRCGRTLRGGRATGGRGLLRGRQGLGLGQGRDGRGGARLGHRGRAGLRPGGGLRRGGGRLGGDRLGLAEGFGRGEFGRRGVGLVVAR